MNQSEFKGLFGVGMIRVRKGAPIQKILREIKPLLKGNLEIADSNSTQQTVSFCFRYKEADNSADETLRGSLKCINRPLFAKSESDLLALSSDCEDCTVVRKITRECKRLARKYHGDPGKSFIWYCQRIWDTSDSLKAA
jgi:hypothetical protein